MDKTEHELIEDERRELTEDERRAALRRPVHVDVQIENGRILCGGFLRDISAVGAAAVMTDCSEECLRTFAENVVVWLNDAASIAARVVWRRDNELGLVFETDEPPPPLLN
jgi:hypothetical protein